MGTELDLDDCAAQSAKATKQLAELRYTVNRLLVLSTKHCDKSHHDWREIEELAYISEFLDATTAE